MAAERAYCAFIESAREFLPPQMQPWAQLAPQVRRAWMMAIAAACYRPSGDDHAS